MKQVIVLATHNSGGEIIKKICEEFGFPFDNPLLDETIKQMGEAISSGEIKTSAEVDLIFKDNARKSVSKQSDWGYFNPYFVDFAGFFAKFLKNPRYIIVFGNFLDIAKRTLPEDYSTEEFLEAFRGAFNHQELLKAFVDANYKSALLVSYEKLMENPRKIVEDIADFLGLEVDEAKIQDILSKIK